jgi:acetyl-CoA carboxylase biotin carboxyl carrier protein
VAVGAKLQPNTVVGQIEAMKIFNEVTAGLSGTVREVCVKNGEFVEFGTVLFRVDPA